MNNELTPGITADQEGLAGPSPHPGPSQAASARLATLAELPQDSRWTLIEDGFTLAREHEVESLFAIANGYIGNRGSLAEGTPLSAPATFVAGVFELEDKPEAVPGLFTLPDWTGIRAWVDGQPLSMEQGQVLEHRRILDLRHGLLWRQWRHRDPNGRISRILALRFASLADRHLLLQSAVFTAENYSAEVRFETCIELPPNVTAVGPPEEYKVRRAATRPNVLPLALRSPGTGITVAFGATSQLITGEHHPCSRDIEMTERRITERFVVPVEIGADYRLDRLVSVFTSREAPQPAAAAVDHANRVLAAGIGSAVAEHKSAWQQRWHHSDITLEGDPALQRSLRFAEYHLISAANPEDSRVSIGARALTGESYKGHVFWDTETYMVPFYTFTHPDSARALLSYRYHTLSAAREKARAAGYRGAMYPWESADTGVETTPRFVIDPRGRVIEVRNGDLENHITADVAYAVWQYCDVTGDEDFLLEKGAEILLETARFWASRGKVESDGRYHIRHVIGPDEYHEDVDDSAYTNLMAAWNLRCAARTARRLAEGDAERWQELSGRLAITPDELDSWLRIADAMFTAFDPRTKLYEQFRGYFQLEPVDLKSYEPRNSAMDVILGHDRIQQTNVVKQADVIMALYLLWDEFPPEVREANFRYYEPRTGHGSSLSPSIHALMAARLGDLPLAEKYLRQAAEIDLGNNMGNAAGGVHAAAIGGLWQAVIFGFAGVHCRPEGLTFVPNVPAHWSRVEFPLQFRGRQLRITLDSGRVKVKVEAGHAPLELALEGGSRVSAALNHEYVADRTRDGWSGWRASV